MLLQIFIFTGSKSNYIKTSMRLSSSFSLLHSIQFSIYDTYENVCNCLVSTLYQQQQKTMSIREILSAIFLCYCCFCFCCCFLLLRCTSFYRWWSSRMILSFMKRVCDHCTPFICMWHTHLWLTTMSCASFFMNESKRKEHFDIMLCIMLARKIYVRNWVHLACSETQKNVETC